jgi:formate-dependent phosphoribosylglycinamide formyltransferase (GAR transformylase)
MKQLIIGTPLSLSTTKVMLLGSGKLGKEVIIALQRLGVEEALRVPELDIRLFGKPESFMRRRMGVALANGKDTDEARTRAKLAASKVVPVKAQ